MTFSPDIDPLTWGMLAGGALLALCYVLWQWRRVRRLSRFVKVDEPSRPVVEQWPSVSIIVDAGGETDRLLRCLPLVLKQEYPGEYEVIVVADGGAEATNDLLSGFKAEFPNLHVTFTPHGMRSLSRKKMALMIGIKAARHEVVLTTCANCLPASEQWLQLMMRNFTEGTDVVLGYAHPDYAADGGPGRLVRIYDTVTTGVQWLFSAITGHPYRGTSDNMAFRRPIFFKTNGYAQSMDLRWGEDDIYVSEIARADNTRVEMAIDSQMTTLHESVSRSLRLHKLRRDFTSRFVRRWPFVMQSIMSLVNYVRLGLLVAVVALNPTNALVLGLSLAVVLLNWVGSATAVSRACRLLGAPRLLLSVPFLALWRPIYNAWYSLNELGLKKSNYTSYI